MRILVVDDIATNRKLLRVSFAADGQTTIEAADGLEALQILAVEKVDAVLTDVMMPGMDGYRLCHEIRTSDRLRDLPIVVYTSSYTSSGDEKLALSLGADKYLKKPAPFLTILAALRGAIAMPHNAPLPEAWQEVKVLKEYSDRLVKKLEERNVSLAEANARLTILDQAKNDFLDLISHEFRTPLNGLLCVGEIILDGLNTPEETEELKLIFARSRGRILSILDDALLLTRIDINGEKFDSVPVSPSTALTRAIESATEFARSRNVTFAVPPHNPPDLVVADASLLERAFHALLETAVKFSREGETVHVASDVFIDTIRIIIDSNDSKIAAGALPKFFDVFSLQETVTPGGHLGLGPAVAHRILSLFGGSVTIKNRAPSGIRLTISVPLTVRS